MVNFWIYAAIALAGLFLIGGLVLGVFTFLRKDKQEESLLPAPAATSAGSAGTQDTQESNFFETDPDPEPTETALPSATGTQAALPTPAANTSTSLPTPASSGQTRRSRRGLDTKEYNAPLRATYASPRKELKPDEESLPQRQTRVAEKKFDWDEDF